MDKKIYYSIFLLLLSFAYTLNGTAQVTLNIDIKDANNEQVFGAELSVATGDSTVLFAIMAEPNYVITLPSAGTYEISIAHMGHAPFNLKEYFSRDSALQVALAPCPYELEEVAIQGETPRKITATGEIFHLSQKAKKTGDPFRALSEIPLLNVDIVNQKVTTNSGEQLLALIDGKLQNSGISPIDPKFIESVEISEVASARFLKMGVRKIINIRLKPNRPMYAYTDIRTRHDIPLREGFGGANFEFGRKKLAFSGSLFYSYLHQDKSDFESREEAEGVSRILNGEQINGNHSWDGSLMAKWTPNEANYFSAIVKLLSQDRSANKNLNGQYVLNKSYELKSKLENKIATDGLLIGLYHEHTFRNKSLLTTFLKYNHCGSETNETLSELYDNAHHETTISEDALRKQYALSIDFDTQEQSYGDINIGNDFEYTSDRNKELLGLSSPSVYTKTWSNYTYLGYTSSWKKLFYMASVGLEHLGVKVAEHTKTCWRPRVSTSLSLQLPRRQSMRLAYNLDNTLPPSAMLFTFNHSTNPMLRIEGNPYLIPEQKHELGLHYNKAFKNFWGSIYASQEWQSNIIEPYIYHNGQTQVKSFHNNGTYKESQIGGSLQYGGNNVTLFFAASHTWKSFNGQETKSLVGLSGYARWDFGKFFIYSNISWKNRDYTPISTIKYKNPMQAHVQIAWQATKQVYVSLGLPYFWGKKSQTTTTEQSVYKSWQHDCFKGMSLRPWLLVSWTLRKNAKEAIPNKMPSI